MSIPLTTTPPVKLCATINAIDKPPIPSDVISSILAKQTTQISAQMTFVSCRFSPKAFYNILSP